MKLAIAFPNFGPYHRARLRALGHSLGRDGHELIAHQMAGSEKKYPWESGGDSGDYRTITLFPDRAIEDASADECARAMTAALDRDRPDVVAICGYVRPESRAALRWARARGKTAVLMSESQEIDRPRTWWKEAIKGRRVRKFSSALVGGAGHRDYLVKLGMPADRIALGYNAVDNEAFAAMAEEARVAGQGGEGRPYFLAVSRFVPEKNLPLLVRAFARYRAKAGPEAWDLALCGGGIGAGEIDEEIRVAGLDRAVHRPGFLGGSDLAWWYAFAGAFVLPSLSEPWGLVANEAAACGVPLILSERAGCSATLVPDRAGASGFRFDPEDEIGLAAILACTAGLRGGELRAMGTEAARIVAGWGPERFAQGMREAIAAAPNPARIHKLIQDTSIS